MTTLHSTASPTGPRRPGARPAATPGPVRLGDILHSICACGAPIVVRFEAGRHGDDYRAIQACARHEPAARRWAAGAARAGPLREHRLTTSEAPQGELTTLF